MVNKRANKYFRQRFITEKKKAEKRTVLLGQEQVKRKKRNYDEVIDLF